MGAINRDARLKLERAAFPALHDDATLRKLAQHTLADTE